MPSLRIDAPRAFARHVTRPKRGEGAHSTINPRPERREGDPFPPGDLACAQKAAFLAGHDAERIARAGYEWSGR